MQNPISKIIPDPIKRSLWLHFRRLQYFGLERYCSVCESSLRFFLPVTSSNWNRSDAKCPICGSVERHRTGWYFLQKKTNIFSKSRKSILHIAPEKQFQERLKKNPCINYLSADLNSPHADVIMDITNIHFQDNSFDVIYCSHVLEHVPDDRMAMRELYRVLKSGGYGVFMVPISRNNKSTFEDPTIVDPEQRQKFFLHPNHVRLYSSDFKDRLQEEGFRVKHFNQSDIVDNINATKFGLKDDDVFLAIK